MNKHNTYTMLTLHGLFIFYDFIMLKTGEHVEYLTEVSTPLTFL